MIETNEPMTTTGVQTEPPQTDLIQTAREAGAAAEERLGDLRDAAISSLNEAKSAATEKVEETKDQAAGEIARTAQGLEAAAEEMEGSPLQQDLLREAADGLKQIAHAVEGKSIGAMASELSDVRPPEPGGVPRRRCPGRLRSRAVRPCFDASEYRSLLGPLRSRRSKPIRGGAIVERFHRGVRSWLIHLNGPLPA